MGSRPQDDNVSSALPSAPQMGSARLIQTNDRRLSQSPVWRSNSLYFAAPTLPNTGPNANQVTARWFRVNTTNINSLSLADTGVVGGEEIASGVHTFFPAVSVDATGNMAIGFAASGSNIFPGSYYTSRLAGSAAGFTEAPSALRAGADYYVRTFNNAGGASRWGDYTGLSIDPTDETTFWVINQSALTRGTTGIGTDPTEDGRWGVAVGSFSAQTVKKRRGQVTSN